MILEETNGLLKNFSDRREIDFVTDQMRQIQRLLRKLSVHGRHARSLDFIGSTLKFIAGTPDRADFELLTTEDNMIIRDINKPTIIYSALQDKINEPLPYPGHPIPLMLMS